ncbi:MAG TPA: ABC transporter permease [Solirubrobacteraceae bacterium]|nr:ABC transporter permease [Solirubrobacteraceae bacterium]
MTTVATPPSTPAPAGAAPAVGAQRIGIAGAVLAAIAWILTLPPIMARTAVPSIVLGLLAAAAGVLVVRHPKHRRLGGVTIAVGLIAVPLALAMTNQTAANVREVFTWSAVIASGLTFTTPLIFAALGGIISERSGVVNIGLEGMMLTGCYFGIFGADICSSWILGALIGIASGAVMGFLHAYFSLHLRANQVVSGTAINLLAVGLTGFLFVSHYGDNGSPGTLPQVPNINIPGIDHTAFFGSAIGNASVLTWVGLLLVPVVWWFLFRTRAGLRLRAIGEQPRAASTVGLKVIATRYAAVTASGAFAALGGVYLADGFDGSFNFDMTDGRGFIALAAVIFGKWNPFGALAATLLFGLSTALAYRLPTFSQTLGTLFLALPYVLTLVAVAGLIGRSRPPAASGIPYVKE